MGRIWEQQVIKDLRTQEDEDENWLIVIGSPVDRPRSSGMHPKRSRRSLSSGFIRSISSRCVKESCPSRALARSVRTMKDFRRSFVAALRSIRLNFSSRWTSSDALRSAEPTSELTSPMRISYVVFCLKKNTIHQDTHTI